MQDERLSYPDLVAPARTFDPPPHRFPGDGGPATFGLAVKRGLLQSTVYGRASRSEFWYFWLFTAFLNLVSLVVTYNAPDLAHLDFAIRSLISIFLTVVFVRRLHDVGRSGWWVFVSLTIVGIFPLFIWSVRKGDAGPNRFDLRDKKAGLNPDEIPGPRSAIDQVERLHSLHLAGAITDEEYQALKKRAL